MVEGGVYYKVFGKHRKLPIGNDSFRNRLIGSYSESADKSLIGFLFISSSTLLSAPFIYLIAISSNYWNIIEDYHLPMLSDKSIAIGLTMFMILCSITVFIVAHWDNFKKLRTADGTPDLSKEIAKAPDVLFKFVSLDYISGALLLIPAVYWFFLSFNTSNANYNIILQFLSLVSLGLFFICVNKVFFDSLNRIHRSLTYKSSVKVRTKKS